ncbi:MAG: FAD-binding protein [Sandaracinus sp.]|nr:FAD-binding protein [Myxococcales bacterium]MCB9614614.1 FAD-binding protein [Sandaracinus sp.]MCB9620388.1 FAD-binding protein [Sandaracinus sp.]
MSLDAALLAIDRACTSGSVVKDLDLREVYARDQSETTPVVPEAVVRVRSTAEVAAVLAACHAHRVPITPRSGGTGRVGGAVPVPGGLVLALEGMDRIDAVEKDDLRVVVEPGVVLQDLHHAVEAEGLFYAPDPNSLESCRIGGNLACNAGGPRAFKYGVTRNWVLGLEVVTADGTVLEVGKPTAKGVTGYDLAGLVVGSEGTLAVVTRATLRLVPKPEEVATLLVFLPSQAALGDAITACLRRRVMPRCLEFLDELALDILRPKAGLAVPTSARAMLLVEVDGEAHEISRQTELVGEAMLEAGALDVLLARSEHERASLWAARRDMSHAMRRQARQKLSEDVVVPRTRIGALLDRCNALSERHGVRVATYGHAGDGNLHVNLLWDDPDDRPKVEAAIRGLMEATVELGGTLSGEHGIGVLKAPYLPLEQSPALIDLQERIKGVFDPRGVLNPGKIFPAGARKFHGAC